MMNKTKSPTRKLAKYLAFIPLALLFITANSLYATSGEKPKEVMEKPQDKKTKINSDKVFVVVEKQPEFPGGLKAMMEFLNDAIKYPVEAQNKKIQGRVTCNFIVEKDGSITDVQIARGINPLLDEEAVRVIELMPNWKPGMQKGEPVRVRYTLPVVFKLYEKDSRKSQVPPPPPPPTKYTKDSDESKNADEVFVVVEKQPEFPGGASAMLRFLNENIRYPKDAQEKRIQGTVVCSFVVNEDGNISDVSIFRGVDPSLDAEAIRVIGAMPAWKPGFQRGKPVNVRFTLPIVFRLKEKEKTRNNVTVYEEKGDNTDKRYFNFVSNNVKYPVIAQENGIAGLVKATYRVNEKGNISDIQITQSADPSLDKEVIRLIKSIPNDIALMKKGEKVNFSALFRLQNEKSPLPNKNIECDVVIVGYGTGK